MGESTGPPVLKAHNVWFVFGAVDFELPVCAGFWWNMDQLSASDGSAEASEAPAVDFIAVYTIAVKKAEAKNSTTKTEQVIAFFFILFYPWAYLVSIFKERKISGATTRYRLPLNY